MTTDLWIASGNPNKRVELDRLLRPLGFDLRLQSEAPRQPQVDEDQPDFAGNAKKKAVALAAVVRAPAVADDSGLCVDALEGRPGVLSARYAGPDASDTDRIAKLLQELRGTNAAHRTAHFVCSLCLVDGTGALVVCVEAVCEGFIRDTPRGDGGFGYDPVFVPLASTSDSAGTAAAGFADSSPTFAELTPDQKDAISHRGKALRKLAAWLRTNPIP